MTIDDLVSSMDMEIINRLGICLTINDRPVRGIWYDDYIEVVGQDASGPSFHCRSPDVDWVRIDDRLIKGGAAYRVVGLPKGNGITRLRLVFASSPA